MSLIRRIVFFLSLFLLVFILKELGELFVLAKSIHPVLGYVTLAILAAFLFYFVVIPVYKIIKIPTGLGPTTDPQKTQQIIQSRFDRFKKNPYLLESGFDFESTEENREGYERVTGVLQKEAKRIRKKYVLQLFYSSSISQNGFLDAILILSSSVNLVKELFLLYNGRVSNRDLLVIARKVYFSMAIGGSEGVEYATQELFSKFATDGFKSVPFADKIFGSLADGFVNAALLTRISLITENYCREVYIKSDRALYPSAEFILTTTKFITGDIVDKLVIELIKMSKEKTLDYVMVAVNPVAHVFGRTMGMVKEGTTRITAYQKEMIKDLFEPFPGLLSFRSGSSKKYPENVNNSLVFPV
jgi:hypothetical protein